MTKKILITSFENFLDNIDNPTVQLAAQLAAQLAQKVASSLKQNIEVDTLTLPVSFQRSFGVLEEYLNKNTPKNTPRYIFELGLAANRPNITLEKFALNYKYCPTSPDNDGIISGGEIIVNNAPTIIENSHFNLETFFLELKKEHPGLSVNVDISAHAGTYVCNSLYFKTLFHYPNIPTLFIHVPQIKEISPNAKFCLVDVAQSLLVIINKLMI